MNVAQAFRSGAAVVDVSDRLRFFLEGEQAAWFLDQLVTQKVDELAPGQGAEALLLTPNGKIQSVMRIVHTGPRLLVDAESLSLVDPLSFFSGRVFATKVELTGFGAATSLVSVIGPRAAGAVCSVTGLREDALPTHEHQCVLFDRGAVVRVERPAPGYDLFLEMAASDGVALLAEAGAEQVDAQGYAALKAFEGMPTFGVDIDGSYLPQEAAMERMVHFKKGCYLGQEAVAMTQRGRIKRRLRRITFDGPQVIGEVAFEDGKVGFVSSFGVDDAAAQGIATVATSVPVGSKVSVGSTAAVIEELPHTTEGPKPPSARELRERLQGGAPR